MTYNTVITFKGIPRQIDPGDLTSAAVLLEIAGFNARISQYTLLDIRRLTFYVDVPEGQGLVAWKAVRNVARKLRVGDDVLTSAQIHPDVPLRTEPRPGKRFHRGPFSGRSVIRDNPKWWHNNHALVHRNTGAGALEAVQHLLESTNPGEPVTIEPTDINRKKKKKAKKLRKAKAKHPATVSVIKGVVSPSGQTAVVEVDRAARQVVGFTPTGLTGSNPGGEPMSMGAPGLVWPAHLDPDRHTGVLRYYKSVDGDHRWRLRSNNSKILAQAEGFSAVGKATGNIDAVRRALVNPKIEFDPESYPNRQ